MPRANRTRRAGRLSGPCQRGARFSAKARTPSRKSSLRKHASRSSTSSRSTSGSSSPSAASSSRSVRLLPLSDSGALAAMRAAYSTPRASTSSASTTSFTSPHWSAVRALMLRAVKNSSRVRGAPIASTNRRRPVCE